MSDRREKERRCKRKLKAKKFSKELDAMEARLWLAYKSFNPHIQCNQEFQTKLEELCVIN